MLKNRKKNGLTIVEILIVLAIIAIYAFSISPNRAYYTIYSIGLSQNGSVQVNDEGKITLSGSPIWVSNSSNL